MKAIRLKLLMAWSLCLLSSLNPILGQVTMDRFLGVNVHRVDPVEEMECVGIVREYHDWEVDEVVNAVYPDNHYEWDPTDFSKSTILSFDDYYARIAESGIEILVDIKGILPIMAGKDPFDDSPNDIPAEGPTDMPSSYVWHADYMTQFASRYGKSDAPKILSPELTKLANNQQKQYYHGMVQYVENWNEPDRWWQCCPFSPEEYAAMSSADWDGFDGTLIGEKPGEGEYELGVKGKGMDFVLSGPSEFHWEYIEGIYDWFHLRGLPFPFKVITIHHYSDDYLIDEPGRPVLGKIGVSPEEEKFRQRCEETVRFRDEMLGENSGVELWLTEFGYDTNPYSRKRVPEIEGDDGFYDRQEVHGQWIVRSFLEIAASGFERGFVFTLVDHDSSVDRESKDPNDNADTNAGLIMDEFHHYQRKTAWYYVHTLKDILAGLYYDYDDLDGSGYLDGGDFSGCSDCFYKEQDFENPDVTIHPRIYRFVENPEDVIDPGKIAYAVWLPSAGGHILENVTVPVPFGTEVATVVNLEPGDPDGRHTVLNNFVVKNGVKQLIVPKVTERPILIVLDEEKEDPSILAPSNLLVESVSCDAVHLSWTNNDQYDKIRIYYARMDSLRNPRNFNLSKAQFYTELDNTQGIDWHSANVSTLDTYTAYWFFVEGVKEDPVYGSLISDKTFYAYGHTLRDDNNNWIYVEEDWLESSGTGNAYAVFDHLSSEDYCPWTCERMDGDEDNESWLWDYTVPAENNFLIIDFPVPYFLDVMYLYDMQGLQELKIEYDTDSEGEDWILIENYLTRYFRHFTSFTNFSDPNVPIKRIRITMMHPQAVVGEILFNGRPLEGEPHYKTFNPCRTTLPDIGVSFSQSIIGVYPNPSKDFINVTLPDHTFFSELRLLDLTGKALERWKIDVEQKNVELSIANMPAGMYLLQALGEDAQELVKIVVE